MKSQIVQRSFLRRQFSHIQTEGLPALWRKVLIVLKIMVTYPPKGGKLLIQSLQYILLVLAILVIRILKPLVFIRFGSIRSDVIGHSVFNPEYYLCEREINNSKTIDCFYFRSSNHPNTQWTLMVQRHLRVGSYYRKFDSINQKIPGWKRHYANLIPEGNGSRDLSGLFFRTKTHFQFTDEENTRGNKFLNELGLKPEDRFVCLIVRDSAYKEKYQKWNNDWSYHDYRDSDIDTYEEAILKLANKGYWIFRMGKAVRKPLKVEHPRILDYANTNHCSDFLDIWLFGNCYFTISTGSGIDSVADVFRKPVVYINYIPLTHLVSWSKTVSIPKKLYWLKKRRMLNVTEQLKNSYLRGQKYAENGIQVVDLKPEEITDAVLEMESKLKGSWEENDEDKMLQNIFWELLSNWPGYHKHHGSIHPEARIGSMFLRENTEWLN